MKNAKITIIILLYNIIITIQNETSELDALIGPFRRLRDEAFKIVNESVENNYNFKLLRSQGKLQRFVKTKFPCPLNGTRSKEIPNSVHKLRPGDIDVIGGIGDSLTAGVSLLATNSLHVLLEHRGFAPSAGGKGSWRKYLTLPNILKIFNPNLVGYATETSLTIHSESQLNLGETGAMSEDMPYMIKVLIKRIKDNPRIDINKHWKMVTFMIGPNNFCSDICFASNVTAIFEKHKAELKEVLTTLKQNLPRTIVNLIPPPNLKILINLTPKLFKCQISHLLECPCLFGPASKNSQEFYINLMEKWQNIDIEIANGNEFDGDNFTVVVQPFSLNFSIPSTAAGSTDYTYLSEDCFHMSQKGNARTNSLWNNIMEPVGMKSRQPSEFFQKFRCPSKKSPFIYTRRNSIIQQKNKYNI